MEKKKRQSARIQALKMSSSRRQTCFKVTVTICSEEIKVSSIPSTKIILKLATLQGLGDENHFLEFFSEGVGNMELGVQGSQNQML